MEFYKNTFRTTSLRLPNYDYSEAGYYFVTICTKDRKEHFGEIRIGIVGLSKIGDIAVHCWREIPKHYSNIELDEFVIMPSHVHGIVAIRNVEDGHARPLHDRSHHLLPVVIGSYKSAVSKLIKKKYAFQWQKSYYEHIIRNEQSLGRIREYIQNNPLKWELDIENQNCMKKDKEYYEKIFG